MGDRMAEERGKDNRPEIKKIDAYVAYTAKQQYRLMYPLPIVPEAGAFTRKAFTQTREKSAKSCWTRLR